MDPTRRGALPARKQLYTPKNIKVYIGAEAISLVEAEGKFKYLGYLFEHMGTEEPTPTPLKTCLARLSAAPLKRYQKLDILRTYVLPKFIYA